MGAALVGSVGAATQGSSGASVAPAWGTGESRTLGNLLILWVGGTLTATLPATPSGWTAVRHVGGTSCSASLFAKIATGGDAAPTVAAVTSTVLSAQLAEFSGLDTATLGDQNGAGTGTTSPLAVTANNPGGGDAQAAELVVYVSVVLTSNSPAMGSIVGSLNNGATAHDTTNAGTAVRGHYDFGYGIAASKAASDQYTLTFSGGTITSPTTAAVVASFKLPTPVVLAGAGSTRSSAGATLSVAVPLAGSGTNATAATGGLSVAIGLAGTGQSSTIATATLGVGVPLTGQGQNATLAAANLLVAVRLAATGSNASGPDTGTLSVALPLAGASQNATISTAILAVADALAGSGSNVGQGDGTLTVGLPLLGAGQSATQSTGSLRPAVSLIGLGFNATVSSGRANYVVPLFGAGSTLATSSARLTLRWPVGPGGTGTPPGHTGRSANPATGVAGATGRAGAGIGGRGGYAVNDVTGGASRS